jgi:hypothetical protein
VKRLLKIALTVYLIQALGGVAVGFVAGPKVIASWCSESQDKGYICNKLEEHYRDKDE